LTTTADRNTEVLRDLKPPRLWWLFGKLLQIRRGSGNEAGVRTMITEFASEHGGTCRTDAAGNLAIHFPARIGYENCPTTTLQGHLDMVEQRNGDGPFPDTIELLNERNWIKANGTSLGADNGIGLAAALDLATDPAIVHGHLQILCTVDEETGMTGAANLDPVALGLRQGGQGRHLFFAGGAPHRPNVDYRGLAAKVRKPHRATLRVGKDIAGRGGGLARNLQLGHRAHGQRPQRIAAFEDTGVIGI